jgi:copper chaperone CopZ
MSVEKTLGHLPGVRSVQVNLVHGIILVDADSRQITEQQIAHKVEDLGYTVVATEAQQYATDEAIFTTIRRRGFLAVALAIVDTLFDSLNLFGLRVRVRTIASAVVALVVLELCPRNSAK